MIVLVGSPLIWESIRKERKLSQMIKTSLTFELSMDGRRKNNDDWSKLDCFQKWRGIWRLNLRLSSLGKEYQMSRSNVRTQSFRQQMQVHMQLL